MNINDISTEKLVGMTLLQNTLKSQLGDGMEFELVYQALLNSMEGQEAVSYTHLDVYKRQVMYIVRFIRTI